MIDMKIMIISAKKALKCINEIKTTKKGYNFLYESPFIPPKKIEKQPCILQKCILQ